MQALSLKELAWLLRLETFLSTWSGADLLEKFMVFFSTIGNKGSLWIAIGIFLVLYPRTRKTGIAVLIALALGAVAGELVLKPLIARPRPFTFYDFSLKLPPPSGYSFPSGHTLSSFASATAIARNHKGFGAGAYGVAALIGLSRVILFVHFPSDVLTGMLLGIGFGLLGDVLADKLVAEVPELLT